MQHCRADLAMLATKWCASAPDRLHAQVDHVLRELAQATQPWDLSGLFSLPAMAAPPAASQAAPAPSLEAQHGGQAQTAATPQVRSDPEVASEAPPEAAPALHEQLEEAISLLLQLSGSVSAADSAAGPRQQPRSPPTPLQPMQMQPSTPPGAVNSAQFPSRIPRPLPKAPHPSNMSAQEPALATADPPRPGPTDAAPGPIKPCEQPQHQPLVAAALPAQGAEQPAAWPAAMPAADAVADPGPGVASPAPPGTAHPTALTSAAAAEPSAPSLMGLPSPAGTARSPQAAAERVPYPAEQEALQATFVASLSTWQASAGSHAALQSQEADGGALPGPGPRQADAVASLQQGVGSLPATAEEPELSLANSAREQPCRDEDPGSALGLPEASLSSISLLGEQSWAELAGRVVAELQGHNQIRYDYSPDLCILCQMMRMLCEA